MRKSVEDVVLHCSVRNSSSDAMAGPVRSLPKNTNRIESKGAGTVAFLPSERLTFGSTCTFASIDFCVWQLPEYDSDAEVLFSVFDKQKG